MNWISDIIIGISDIIIGIAAARKLPIGFNFYNIDSLVKSSVSRISESVDRYSASLKLSRSRDFHTDDIISSFSSGDDDRNKEWIFVIALIPYFVFLLKYLLY